MQFIPGIIFGIDPVIEQKGVVAIAKGVWKLFPVTSLNQYLPGIEAA